MTDVEIAFQQSKKFMWCYLKTANCLSNVFSVYFCIDSFCLSFSSVVDQLLDKKHIYQ